MPHAHDERHHAPRGVGPVQAGEAERAHQKDGRHPSERPGGLDRWRPDGQLFGRAHGDLHQRGGGAPVHVSVCGIGGSFVRVVGWSYSSGTPDMLSC